MFASRSRYTSAAVRSICGIGLGAMGGAGAAICAAARRGVAAASAAARAALAVSTFCSPRWM